MPTTYSHYRFGKEVYKKLTPAQKAIIDPTVDCLIWGFTDRICYFTTTHFQKTR